MELRISDIIKKGEEHEKASEYERACDAYHAAARGFFSLSVYCRTKKDSLAIEQLINALRCAVQSKDIKYYRFVYESLNSKIYPAIDRLDSGMKDKVVFYLKITDILKGGKFTHIQAKKALQKAQSLASLHSSYFYSCDIGDSTKKDVALASADMCLMDGDVAAAAKHYQEAMVSERDSEKREKIRKTAADQFKSLAGGFPDIWALAAEFSIEDDEKIKCYLQAAGLYYRINRKQEAEQVLKKTVGLVHEKDQCLLLAKVALGIDPYFYKNILEKAKGEERNELASEMTKLLMDEAIKNKEDFEKVLHIFRVIFSNVKERDKLLALAEEADKQNLPAIEFYLDLVRIYYFEKVGEPSASSGDKISKEKARELCLLAAKYFEILEKGNSYIGEKYSSLAQIYGKAADVTEEPDNKIECLIKAADNSLKAGMLFWFKSYYAKAMSVSPDKREQFRGEAFNKISTYANAPESKDWYLPFLSAASFTKDGAMQAQLYEKAADAVLKNYKGYLTTRKYTPNYVLDNVDLTDILRITKHPGVSATTKQAVLDVAMEICTKQKWDIESLLTSNLTAI